MKADELEQRLKNALIYGTSHPEAYMTKADELWEKYAIDELTDRKSFLAALKEYGEHVKAEAVKVCRALPPMPGTGFQLFDYPDNNDCAAAIEKMELP